MAVQQTSIPLIDVSALMTNGPKEYVARSIGEACRDAGFFYIVGHGVDRGLHRPFWITDPPVSAADTR